MPEPKLDALNITVPTAAASVRNLEYKHGFYVKAFPDNAGVLQPVTAFTEGDDLSDFIPGAFPFTRTIDSEERTMLSGIKVRGKRVVTADNQTIRLEIFNGEEKYVLLHDRSIDWENAPKNGQALAFARTYPDGSALVGALFVEKMDAEGDPDAAQFGYDTEFSFTGVTWVDVREPEVP